MIHFIDKPGFYRTYSATPPVLVSDVDAQRDQCRTLILSLIHLGRRDDIFTLLQRHGAKNFPGVADDHVPGLLAELRAVALFLGVE